MLESHDPNLTGSVARKPQQRARVVVFGGGYGMFPPIFERINSHFEVVARPVAVIPRWVETWHLLTSVRWPKSSWYREWRRRLEKTPGAFRMRTRAAERALGAVQSPYDAIMYFGAMQAPARRLDKPLYLFADSCRWLSSQNAYDTASHFANSRDREAWLRMEGDLYRHAERIFVGSEFVRRAMLEGYGLDPGKVISSGFGGGDDFGEPYEKVFDGRSILYIGKGDFERKGGRVLLEAFRLLRRELPDATLHIVGQDSLASGDGIVSHGFIGDRRRLIELMRQAHVFTLPSLVDRNPMSVLDAMAAATPCVTSDYGAIPELVGDAGLIAPCNDVELTARCLAEILRDSDRARAMGRAGYRRYRDVYNWESVWSRISSEIEL